MSKIDPHEDAKLDEFTKEEFRDKTRNLKPMTDEEFAAAWAEFSELKRQKEMQ